MNTPKKIFMLTTYAASTYSYSGIEQNNIYLHLTEEGARNHAMELGLIIVPYCKDENKHATLDALELHP